jgi:arginase
MTLSRVAIIKVPFDLGAGTRGASLGPDCLLQEAGLTEKLNSLSIPYEIAAEVVASMVPDAFDPAQLPPNMKHTAEVYAMSDSLAGQVSAAVASGSFPLVLGGDHSIAIGTIAGLAEHYANMGVIWFDAHSDMNTEHTSPSGNIHGMSLGISLGRGFDPLTKLRGICPKIKPEHVAIVGARSLDPDEKQFIRSLGIACYTMHDIDRMGIARVMDEVIRRMQRETDGVHISFDIDSVDPREAPGTGTPVKGGLSYREAHLAMELLYQAGIATSAELVEVNPSLDQGLKTATLAVELIGSLLGDQIL